jgi:methionyl-tRNA formyltransferase
LQHAIDTGDVLLQERIPISPDMTAGELHDTMMEVGAQTLVKTLHGLIAGTIQSKPQEETLAILHAPKIFTKDCQINWQQPVAQIHNLIRGLAPFPGALTKVDGKIVKLFITSIVYENPKEPIGSFVTDGKTYVRFACSDGYIQLKDIQWEGKKRMPIADFLRGYKKAD